MPELKHFVQAVYPLSLQKQGIEPMGGTPEDYARYTESETGKWTEVAKAAAMAKLGRYVPGFDLLIPPDATWDNFKYAAEKIKKVCYGECT